MVRSTLRYPRRLAAGLLFFLGLAASGAPVNVDVPAQSAATALLALAGQAKIEILFPYDQLERVDTAALQGRFEPGTALTQLLANTGFIAQTGGPGKFVVTAIATGVIRGRLLRPNGDPAPSLTVRLAGTRQFARTDDAGDFVVLAVAAGTRSLVVQAEGFQPLQLEGLTVEAGRTVVIAPQRLRATAEVMVLEPYIVYPESSSLKEDRDASLIARRAAGNLDLPRTRDDALPFAVYTREQIQRSGVVNLNQFLQRELLDSDGAASPSEQRVDADPITTGSSNLKLRGFEFDETVIYVNGRRLPETLKASVGKLDAPDVNFIPLGLIQQVEVLPVSSAAIYGGNAVGGVINIVLRPDIDATELTATYTNAIGRYDAPESTVTLQHGRSLLGGRLRLRLSLTSASYMPPTELELGLLQERVAAQGSDANSLFRATPNIRSSNNTPLFGTGTSRFTSVAPGADGNGGLAAFNGRNGVRSTTLFDGPGLMASSPLSLDYAFGRRQRRDTLFASIVGDPFKWLQLGIDVSHSRAAITRGLNLFSQDLTLTATNPLNPFGRAVVASAIESTSALGVDYNEARLQMSSAVFGILVKLPADWRVALDTQYSRSLTDFRGFSGVDAKAWQRVVTEGRYNPLRDTQVFAAPQVFLDEVLIHRGMPGQFIRLSDYDTLDAALRVTNQSLNLPTGRGMLNVGGDYRRVHLAPFADYLRYGNGNVVGNTTVWSGRSIERYSAFAELQAPLLPRNRLPRWMTHLEGDLAVRGIASDRANEAYLAPTFALKAEFVGGLSFRGSVSVSNRFPTPALSGKSSVIRLPGSTPGSGGSGGGATGVLINDPVLNESYVVNTDEPLQDGLQTEAALTQTAGVIYRRGLVHRFRAALDFVDTHKTDELFTLDAQGAVNLERLFPGQVERDASGRITFVYVGNVNAAQRRSQNWNLSLDYAWSQCFGGTLEVYSRWVHFQRYDRQILPTSPVVNQLSHPDGSAGTLLRDRVNFGASWNRQKNSFGLDGHYFGPRILPESEWPAQGSDRIAGSCQFDAWVQRDLRPWLPWKERNYGLTAQVRVNNIFGAAFPHYANDPSGAGVQPYGDWRGQVYSLSLTATF